MNFLKNPKIKKIGIIAGAAIIVLIIALVIMSAVNKPKTSKGKSADETLLALSELDVSSVTFTYQIDVSTNDTSTRHLSGVIKTDKEHTLITLNNPGIDNYIIYLDFTTNTAVYSNDEATSTKTIDEASMELSVPLNYMTPEFCKSFKLEDAVIKDNKIVCNLNPDYFYKAFSPLGESTVEYLKETPVVFNLALKNNYPVELSINYTPKSFNLGKTEYNISVTAYGSFSDYNSTEVKSPF